MFFEINLFIFINKIIICFEMCYFLEKVVLLLILYVKDYKKFYVKERKLDFFRVFIV